MSRLSYFTSRAQIYLVTIYTVFICFIQAATNDTERYADTCFEDRNGTFPCSSTITGNLVLIAFYGLVLGLAGVLITDGAELLLRLGISPSIVGSILLPILGAIPDCGIIIVSGLGEKAEAQEKLSVGVGTLTGSSVMMLTVAWAGSLLIGRCELDDNGESIDGTGQGRISWTKQGITLLPEFRSSITIMLITSLFYLVVQSADWYFGARNKAYPQPSYVRNSALATMVLCIAGLLGYIARELYISRKHKFRFQRGNHICNNSNVLHHANAVVDQILSASSSNGGISNEAYIEDSQCGSSPSTVEHEREISYKTEDDDKESKLLIKVEDDHILTKQTIADGKEQRGCKARVILKSSSMLIVGVALVSLLASPMCKTIDALTNKRNKPSYVPINSFYVSFIVTPLCSNASELVSSLIFASRRKRENATVTYYQIFGACIVNNTLCLGIFMALVYFRELDWYYSAEVVAVLVVQLCIGLISYKKTFKVYLAVPVAFVYIMSLVLVYVLEAFLDWD